MTVRLMSQSTISQDAPVPQGKVLQVVHGSASTEISTSSTSFQTTGLTLSLTPSETTSKVLIIASFSSESTTTARNVDLFGYEITRNGTQIVTDGAARWGVFIDSVGSHRIDSTIAVNYLDSPASTSALTYDFRFKSRGGTVKAQPFNMPTLATIMEIAG